MRRSGFKRKPGSPFSSFANRGTALRRTAMKKRARKQGGGGIELSGGVPRRALLSARVRSLPWRGGDGRALPLKPESAR
jgi:hypothetical protein